MFVRGTMSVFGIAEIFAIFSSLGSLQADQPLAATENSVTADQILSVDFDTIPEGLVLRSPEILLDGDVRANGDLNVDGEVESTAGGFRFPDGTVQTTATMGGSSEEQVGSLSPNAGLYSNRIADLWHPASFVEVCFRDGGIPYDQHFGGGASAGGNCLPGDVGWIIEINERSGLTWEMAKAECLAMGMRLPEVFEFKYSCKNAGLLGLLDMTNGLEWAGNSADLFLYTIGTQYGTAVPIFGGAGCNNCSAGWVGKNPAADEGFPFRCVR